MAFVCGCVWIQEGPCDGFHRGRSDHSSGGGDEEEGDQTGGEDRKNGFQVKTTEGGVLFFVGWGVLIRGLCVSNRDKVSVNIQGLR